MTAKKLPAAYFVSVEALTAWARGAAARETLVYARASFLPKGSQTGQTVRDLRAAGLVEMWQERDGEDRFRYIVRRTAKAWPSGVADIGQEVAA